MLSLAVSIEQTSAGTDGHRLTVNTTLKHSVSQQKSTIKRTSDRVVTRLVVQQKSTRGERVAWTTAYQSVRRFVGWPGGRPQENVLL